MSKELEALVELKRFVHEFELGNVDKLYVDGSFNILEKALKDYEWLKSIIPIDAMYMWNLSSDDKLRLLKIMGIEYEKINEEKR